MPSGTKSVITLVVSPNRTKRTSYGVTIEHTTEIISTNSPTSEYTFDSAYMRSTTGVKRTFNYDGSQVDLGLDTQLFFLIKLLPLRPRLQIVMVLMI